MIICRWDAQIVLFSLIVRYNIESQIQVPSGPKEITSICEAGRSNKYEVYSQLKAHAMSKDIQIQFYTPAVSKVGLIQPSVYTK